MGFIVFEEEAFNYLDAQLENFVKRMDRIRERSEDKTMNKATTYNLPSVVVIGCRLVLLAIPSWSCLPSLLRMVCIKSNTMLKHTAVVRPSGWRRKASKERCFMAGLYHWIFVSFSLGNKLIHVIS